MPRRSRMECMMMHPSMLARLSREIGLDPAAAVRDQTRADHLGPYTVWTPADSADTLADFDAHAADAIRVGNELAPVIDITTRERVQ